MPRLTDMDIDMVSLVDKGANGRKFAVLKRDSGRRPMVSNPDAPQSTESDANVSSDTEPESGIRSALGTIAKALGLSDEHTFVGFVDNEGKTLTPETVEKAVGSYRDFVLDAIKVEKAGRKISGARMSQLKSAMSVLGELINGVEQGYWTPPTGIEKGTDDMNEQELRDLVTKTVGETFESAFGEDGAGTQAIAKAFEAAKPKDEDKVEKTEETPKEEAKADAPATVDLSPVTDRLDEMGTTQGQVIEAVAKMADRIDNLEGGSRQSAASDENAGKAKVTKREKGDMSALHGILG